MVPLDLVLDPLLRQWLQEDIGRGDRTTQGLGSCIHTLGEAQWVAKATGVVAGLSVARRVFQLLDGTVQFALLVEDGATCEPGQKIAGVTGSLGSLLMGERVALNLAMRLSGIATMTRQYCDRISDLPTQLVDTRKTTPGLRLLEKYATWVGGARNHRMGLDDGVMVKENHIAAAGGIQAAVDQIRQRIPYPLTIEVETETLDQVQSALIARADIIMLDNMPLDLMRQAVALIRQSDRPVPIEASGNITLDTLRPVAETGVDYISTSAPITRSPWLDLSMRIEMPLERV
ncbi:carboxylating nicotinate-nucleotide diphosphorylase [Leptolyngbya sp. PCC 6406]|uniref:carboxylating nicotinate-nucleotide diphosphorylase n=1 Tax=Leptolyngbya sp. PCC 6406 TaxID=1173264 RepID=UPI0002ACCB83|nr:carboxylating nicotinate-nucleotide diphosphorylase [Leptolyngbya sp. PCC 6406]